MSGFDESKIKRSSDGKFSTTGGGAKGGGKDEGKKSEPKKAEPKSDSKETSESSEGYKKFLPKKSDLKKMTYREHISAEVKVDQELDKIREAGGENSPEYKQLDKVRALHMNLRSAMEKPGPYATAKGRGFHRENVKMRKEYAKKLIEELYSTKNTLDLFYEKSVKRGRERYGSK